VRSQLRQPREAHVAVRTTHHRGGAQPGGQDGPSGPIAGMIVGFVFRLRPNPNYTGAQSSTPLLRGERSADTRVVGPPPGKSTRPVPGTGPLGTRSYLRVSSCPPCNRRESFSKLAHLAVPSCGPVHLAPPRSCTLRESGGAQPSPLATCRPRPVCPGRANVLAYLSTPPCLHWPSPCTTCPPPEAEPGVAQNLIPGSTLYNERRS